MPVDRFEHINIRSRDIHAARDFYVDVMGLQVGPRPPFASQGYWLYLGHEPVIHVVQRSEGDPPRGDTGTLDHVAFRGRDLEAMRAQLRTSGIAFREQIVPHDLTVQLFVHDPDGVKIELNFAPVQKERA